MKNNKSTKHYWGIGLENETYLQFENSLIMLGDFIQNSMGRERYSLDYTSYYAIDALTTLLQAAFKNNLKYQVSSMLNSHSLEKLDTSYNHKTIYSDSILVNNSSNDTLDNELVENPNFLGKTLLELFLDKQPYNIKSMITTKTNPTGAICFDGDSIEFVTKYFENTTVQEACNELNTTKNIFIDQLNESRVLKEKVSFPTHNSGINQFVSNLKNLVLFNNGTYHFHITLPTYTENGRIVDYAQFEKNHINSIYLIQWFEPLFIATLGSPDIMAVISKKHNLKYNYAMGSMRNAISRYIGVGTYHESMGKGKILTYKVEDFRKLLPFKKEDAIWWRDKVEEELDYNLLPEIGLDFNLEKMYQSGFEIRCFDEFPIAYLNDVLYALLLICEHALTIKNVTWSHHSALWNSIIFKTLKNGANALITKEEKEEVLQCLELLDSHKIYKNTLFIDYEENTLLDVFFFNILQILHERYKDTNSCLNKMLGDKPKEAPRWENFNVFQVNEHYKQLVSVNE